MTSALLIPNNNVWWYLGWKYPKIWQCSTHFHPKQHQLTSCTMTTKLQNLSPRRNIATLSFNFIYSTLTIIKLCREKCCLLENVNIVKRAHIPARHVRKWANRENSKLSPSLHAWWIEEGWKDTFTWVATIHICLHAFSSWRKSQGNEQVATHHTDTHSKEHTQDTVTVYNPTSNQTLVYLSSRVIFNSWMKLSIILFPHEMLQAPSVFKYAT